MRVSKSSIDIGENFGILDPAIFGIAKRSFVMASASLQVRCAHNSFSSLMDGRMGRARFFSRREMDVMRGRRPMKKVFNSLGFHNLVGSDRTCGDLMGISRKKRFSNEEEDNRFQELDVWMRDSATEIVRNIGEAPLLVYIYSDNMWKNSSSSTGTRLVIEKAIAETWPMIKGRWSGGISPIPDGVILVEELKAEEIEKSDDTIINNQLCSATKTWGVLIQAKGLNATACYLLKTSRVHSFLGFCTHFCLAKVECFIQNAETQLKNLWLQR